MNYPPGHRGFASAPTFKTDKRFPNQSKNKNRCAEMPEERTCLTSRTLRTRTNPPT